MQIAGPALHLCIFCNVWETPVSAVNLQELSSRQWRLTCQEGLARLPEAIPLGEYCLVAAGGPRICLLWTAVSAGAPARPS